MSYIKIISFILLIFFFPIFLFGQITLELMATNPDARIFPLGNVDFTQTGTIPSFYFFQITNEGPQERIIIIMEIKLQNQIVLRAESDDFKLPNGAMEQISHQQINLGHLIINDSLGNPQTVSFDNVLYSLDQVGDLQDVAIRTGRLKAGRYTLTITALVLSTGVEVRRSVDFIITNPTSVYIFYPGGPIADPDVKTINTVFPFLQWFSDAEIFNIYVWDKRPEVNDIPILQVRNHRERFLQYPASTSPLPLPGGGEFVGPVRLLEYNKDYFWLVEAVIPVVSGSPITIKTDYFRFNVLEPGQSPTDASQIWSLLEQLLGPGHPVLVQLKAEGYIPDDSIFEDDKPVTIAKVIEYLNKVQTNKAKVLNANSKNK